MGFAHASTIEDLDGAQYRWDNTIDAPYRSAMPVRPAGVEISRKCQSLLRRAIA